MINIMYSAIGFITIVLLFNSNEILCDKLIRNTENDEQFNQTQSSNTSLSEANTTTNSRSARCEYFSICVFRV